MAVGVLQRRSSEVVHRVHVDVAVGASQQEVQDRHLPVGSSEMKCRPLVHVRGVRIRSVPDQRLDRVHVSYRRRVAHGDCRVHPQQLSPSAPQQRLDLHVAMAQRIGERRSSHPVLDVHLRLLLQQVLHHCRVALTRCQVEGGPRVVVAHVDLDAVRQHPQDLQLVARRRVLAHQDPSLLSREAQALTLSPECRSNGILAVPDGVVERRVVVLVLDGGESAVGQQQLHRLHLTFATCDVQRRPAVGVRLVDMEADPKEPLHLLQLPTSCSPTEGGDVLSLPPLVQVSHLLLNVGQDDGVEVVVVLGRVLVVSRQAHFFVVLLFLGRLVLLQLIPLLRPVCAKACIALRVPARSCCTASMFRQLELFERVLCDDLLVIGVRLEHRHDLRSHQSQADGARAAAGASGVDVADTEEEGEVADASARPDRLVMD
mmetsp:Transcript_10641/g.35629  ORF Transcript_10641/g.35629 Transcript_10641/m.35629 type:complete len:430 (-) Transcript_10641:7188-8477(-)